MLLTIIILSIIAFAIALAVLVTWKQKQIEKRYPNADIDKLLEKGSRGTEVIYLQKWINTKLLNEARLPIQVGIFGDKTEEALMWVMNAKQISLKHL